MAGWPLAFLTALIGISLFSAEPPNWAALITDVILPEHRGTVVGFSRIFRAVANALSVSLTGVIIGHLTAVYPSPTNYAIGLSLFQTHRHPRWPLLYIHRQNCAKETSRPSKQILTQRAQS